MSVLYQASIVIQITAFCLLVLTSNSCQINKKSDINEELRIYQNESYSETIQSLVIENPSNLPVSFNLEINNEFPLKMTDILDNVRSLSAHKSIPVEQAAWEYVFFLTFHSDPYTEESWQHEPLIFLNSLGGGFCDDRASVLAKLWMELGFKAKIIRLEGHVVPEVFSGNKWKMYDPDEGVYYLNDRNEIASVSELEKNPHWISHPQKNKVFSLKPNLSLVGEIAKEFANFYKTT